MQIIIQKQFLILVEVSENLFRLFLIVINFVFNIFENTSEVFVSSVKEVKQEIEKVKENFSNFYKDTIEKIGKTFNFIRALFGFNIYKLGIVEIKTKTRETKIVFKNNSFLIYSNLLAPPTH